MKYKIEIEMKLVESLKVLSYCCKQLEQACECNAVEFYRHDETTEQYESGVFIHGISEDSELLMASLKFCLFCGKPIQCEGREVIQNETATSSEHIKYETNAAETKKGHS